MMKPLSLERFPLHLGLGARAVAQPEFTGMEWYAAYVERNAADGREGRLVSLYSFSESWTSWERHPVGDEAVICTAGEITLIQELPDGTRARPRCARATTRSTRAASGIRRMSPATPRPCSSRRAWERSTVLVESFAGSAPLRGAHNHLLPDRAPLARLMSEPEARGSEDHERHGVARSRQRNLRF